MIVPLQYVQYFVIMLKRYSYEGYNIFWWNKYCKITLLRKNMFDHYVGKSSPNWTSNWKPQHGLTIVTFRFRGIPNNNVLPLENLLWQINLLCEYNTRNKSDISQQIGPALSNAHLFYILAHNYFVCIRGFIILVLLTRKGDSYV